MTSGLQKRAFISVYDKDGIDDFAQQLVGFGWEVVSSGGTARFLEKAGVPVTSVEKMVEGIFRTRLRTIGLPDPIIDIMFAANVFCLGPILDHRLVTLRPEVHGGLISDLDNPAHDAQLNLMRITKFDLVVCDFYPLQAAISKPGATIASVLHDTDIGGPTMVRSAAKGGRGVICRVADRSWVLAELQTNGCLSPASIQRLRATAERVVAEYCLASAKFHLEMLPSMAV